MSNRNRSKPKGLNAWLSANNENRDKRFSMVGQSLYFNKQFQALTNGSKLLYLYCANEAAGHREFTFPRATAKKYGVGETSLRRGIDELVKAGFIEVVRSGWNVREPSVYRFNLSWKN